MRCSCLLGAALLAGCAHDPVVMDSAYRVDGATPGPVATAGCAVEIQGIDDRRHDRDSLGRLGLTEVSARDAVLWVRNALTASGIRDNADSGPAEARLSVSVALMLANIRSSSTSKVSNVVLGASYDNYRSVEYFRGSHVGVNWGSSSGEIAQSLNLALRDSVEQLLQSLQTACDRQSVVRRQN